MIKEDAHFPAFLYKINQKMPEIQLESFRFPSAVHVKAMTTIMTGKPTGIIIYMYLNKLACTLTSE